MDLERPPWMTREMEIAESALTYRGFKRAGCVGENRREGEVYSNILRYVSGKWWAYLGAEYVTLRRFNQDGRTTVPTTDIKALRAKLDELGIKEEE